MRLLLYLFYEIYNLFSIESLAEQGHCTSNSLRNKLIHWKMEGKV